MKDHRYRSRLGSLKLGRVANLCVVLGSVLLVAGCASSVEPATGTPSVTQETVETASPASKVLGWQDLQVSNLLVSSSSLPAESLAKTPESSPEGGALPGKLTHTVETDPDHGRLRQANQSVQINPTFPFDYSAHSFVWTLQEQAAGRIQVQVKLGSSGEISPKPLIVDTGIEGRVLVIHAVSTADRLYALLGSKKSSSTQLWSFEIGNDGSLRALKASDFPDSSPLGTPEESAPHADLKQLRNQYVKSPHLVVTRGSLYASLRRGRFWEVLRYSVDTTGKLSEPERMEGFQHSVDKSVQVIPAGNKKVGLVYQQSGETYFSAIADGGQVQNLLHLPLSQFPQQVRMLDDVLLLGFDSPESFAQAGSPESSGQARGTVEPIVGEMPAAEFKMLLISTSKQRAIRLFSPIGASFDNIGIVQTGFLCELSQAEQRYRFLISEDGSFAPTSALIR